MLLFLVCWLSFVVFFVCRFVVRCVLFVGCSLFVHRCLLFVVCCVLCVVRCSLVVARCL